MISAGRFSFQTPIQHLRGLGDEVTSLSAEILRLDQILRHGSAAEPARVTLRQYAEQKTANLFPEDAANVDLVNSSTYELLQRLEDMLLALKPANPRARSTIVAFARNGSIEKIMLLNFPRASAGVRPLHSLPVRPCQGSGPGSCPAATSASRSR